MVQKEDLQALVAIIYILAENLQTICDSLPGETAKEHEKTPAKVKKISLEEVSGKLAEISQTGKTAAVRELIQKHGGSRLSDVEPSQYAAILKEAEVLANAK